MKVIALQGKPMSGKTPTIKKIIKKIIEDEIFNLCAGQDKNKILNYCQQVHRDLNCKFEYNGIKIGITTRGDDENSLRNDFEERQDCNFSDCDIVVCAMHTYGKTVDFVKKHANDGLLIHSKWVVYGDCCEQEREKANQLQAETIIKNIKQFLEGKVH